MLSQTLNEGLEVYGIGQAIRDLRAEKGLGLEQLGKHTGLSAGMLSKIERGNIFPTLPTLLRIAMVFGVGLDHFFAADNDEPEVAVVRREDRMRLPNTTAGTPQFHFESLDFPITGRSMESFLAEFSSEEPTEPHSHPGAEIVYVMCGCLQITIRSISHNLNEGDSIYFDSGPEHSYARIGAESCSAVVVVSHDRNSRAYGKSGDS